MTTRTRQEPRERVFDPRTATNCPAACGCDPQPPACGPCSSFFCCHAYIQVVASGFTGACAIYNGTFNLPICGDDGALNAVYQLSITGGTIRFTINKNTGANARVDFYNASNTIVATYNHTSGTICIKDVIITTQTYGTFTRVSTTCPGSPLTIQAGGLANPGISLNCLCKPLVWPTTGVLTISSPCALINGSHAMAWTVGNGFTNACAGWVRTGGGFTVGLSPPIGGADPPNPFISFGCGSLGGSGTGTPMSCSPTIFSQGTFTASGPGGCTGCSNNFSVNWTFQA